MIIFKLLQFHCLLLTLIHLVVSLITLRLHYYILSVYINFIFNQNILSASTKPALTTLLQFFMEYLKQFLLLLHELKLSMHILLNLYFHKINLLYRFWISIMCLLFNQNYYNQLIKEPN